MKSDNRPTNPPSPPDPPSKGSGPPEDAVPEEPGNPATTGNASEAQTPPPPPVKGADISSILGAWTYNPSQINARRILTDAGEECIQVRLDLGILQMHASGRPDGTRPMGFESLLEYYENLLDESQDGPDGARGGRRSDEIRGSRDPGAEQPPRPAKGPESTETPEIPGDEDVPNPSDDAEAAPTEERPGEFKLSGDDCQALREEAAQFYHRYVAMMALEDFYAVVRDTTRNLRVLDLCRQYAENDADREYLDQFRPYILMFRARALASQAILNKEPKAALHAIDEALDALKQHFDLTEEPTAFDMSGEVQMLRSMRDSLVPKLPISPMAELRARLSKAIETENYELAAILRDELKHMKD
jgi:hypothetical protein